MMGYQVDFLPDDISTLIFRLTLREDAVEFSIDSQMFRVIAEMDGNKNVGYIAKKTGMDLKTIKEIIQRLLKLKIIEPTEGAVPMLKEDFFKYLIEQLSLATGPLAEILVVDATSGLGYKPSQFPKNRAFELVDLLSLKIYREEKRVVFKKNLAKKILNEGG